MGLELKTLKCILLFLIVSNSFAYDNPKLELKMIAEPATRRYADYVSVLFKKSNELELKKGKNAVLALSKHQLQDKKLNFIKDQLINIIQEADLDQKVSSPIFQIYKKVFELIRSPLRFSQFNNEDKEGILFVVNLAFYSLDFLNVDHRKYYKSHDLLYLDVVNALRKLVQKDFHISKLKTFALHPVVTGMINENVKEVEKLKFANICRYKYLYDYFSQYIDIEMPYVESNSTAAVRPHYNYKNEINTEEIRRLLANSTQRLMRSNGPLKVVKMPVNVQGCENQAYIYEVDTHRIDYDELERLIRINRSYTLPILPRELDDNDPILPFDPRPPREARNPLPNIQNTPMFNPGSIPSLNIIKGMKIKSNKNFYDDIFKEYMRHEAVKNTLRIRKSYAYNFGAVVENKLKIKSKFIKDKSFNQHKYNILLKYLLVALNKRYNQNLFPESVFANEITIADSFNQIDFSLNEERPIDLTQYCMEEDINDCDGKILRPNIYILNYDTKIKVSTLEFHPLSVVKSFGRSVEVEANKIIAPWFDTSGRKLVQEGKEMIFDPGTISQQGHSHKKKDDQDCDINFLGLKVNCKTYHYYSFHVIKGKQPQKKAKKLISENGGDISFKIYETVIGTPMIVANGGLGDKGYTGTASPNCKVDEHGKLTFVNHYLRSSKWVKVGESRDFEKAKRKVSEKTDASINQGISGDGADGGRGGKILLYVPTKIKKTLVYSVDGGQGGQAGDPQECGPVRTENYNTIIGNRGNDGKKGVINEVFID